MIYKIVSEIRFSSMSSRIITLYYPKSLLYRVSGSKDIRASHHKLVAGLQEFLRRIYSTLMHSFPLKHMTPPSFRGIIQLYRATSEQERRASHQRLVIVLSTLCMSNGATVSSLLPPLQPVSFLPTPQIRKQAALS